MRALVFDDGLSIRDVPKPVPGAGEALIRVSMAGICNTDLEIAKGYMGFRGVLGHEFVGVVEESANSEIVGKRVVGEINCACHRCAFCEDGMEHHCPNRTVLGILGRNGAFAEYLTLPEENLHLVASHMRDDVAVFTEPTAAAFRILEQIDVTEDDSVIVHGDGKLGQLIAQVLWQRTRRLVCVGRQEWKLAMLDKLGIPTQSADDPALPAGRADIVIEVTGTSAGLARALELTRPEGILVLKTTVADAYGAPFSLPVINEITLVGSRCGPFRPALEALALGNVRVASLVSATFDLENGVEAMARAASRGTMKVLVRMHASD